MKRIWILIVFAFLMACSCSFPVSLLDDVPAVSTPSVTCRPPEASPVGIETGNKFSVIKLHRSGGDLQEQLRAQVPGAEALAQDMFVEFNASW
jgi:biopolymer transport protein ExbD